MIINSGRSKVRTAVAALAVATLALAGAVTEIARTTSPAQAVAGVEDDGAGCAVSLPGSVASNSKLPDPFTKLNGQRMTSKSEWTCRREEIKQLAEKYVYGTKPAKPTVSGTVSGSNITVNVSANGTSASFSASVSLPSGSGPFPAVVVYGGFGADTATMKSAGAAIINYDPYTVGKEGTGRSNKQGAFYTLYGSNSTTGLLQAWGWGVSRIIDVIEQSGGSVLRADGVGISGCSRFGKGAFVGGVFDQRIALTMPVESGSAGVPIFRGIPGEGAQSLSSAYGEQPWLGDAFGSYTGNPAGLPVDTHEMVAMVAPRGLLIMDNPHIANLGPKSASVAALGGAEVYKALGVGSNVGYISNVTDGNHCATRSEWRQPITDAIKKFLVNSGSFNGTINMHSKATGNLADWRTWSTPTLSDGGGTTTTTTTTTTTPTTTTTTTPTTTTTTGGEVTTTTTTTRPTTTTTTTTSTTTSTTGGGSGCTAAFDPPINAWTGGFVANVKITSTTSINSWRVTVNVPSGAAITSSWNGTASGSTGAVTYTPVASWNAPVSPGAPKSFGFQGTGSPTGMTLSCAAA